jgi:hypothetical protein
LSGINSCRNASRYTYISHLKFPQDLFFQPFIFIEVSISCQESERSCICVLGESILHVSMILR